MPENAHGHLQNKTHVCYHYVEETCMGCGAEGFLTCLADIARPRRFPPGENVRNTDQKSYNSVRRVPTTLRRPPLHRAMPVFRVPTPLRPQKRFPGNFAVRGAEMPSWRGSWGSMLGCMDIPRAERACRVLFQDGSHHARTSSLVFVPIVRGIVSDVRHYECRNNVSRRAHAHRAFWRIALRRTRDISIVRTARLAIFPQSVGCVVVCRSVGIVSTFTIFERHVCALLLVLRACRLRVAAAWASDCGTAPCGRNILSSRTFIASHEHNSTQAVLNYSGQFCE